MPRTLAPLDRHWQTHSKLIDFRASPLSGGFQNPVESFTPGGAFKMKGLHGLTTPCVGTRGFCSKFRWVGGVTGLGLAQLEYRLQFAFESSRASPYSESEGEVPSSDIELSCLNSRELSASSRKPGALA